MRTLGVTSINAESCYDRISHLAASLACQRWGVPPPAMVTMLTAIQLMHFHLRTAYGDSESAYSSSATHVFQGICQGNGAGPAVWLAISTCLVTILNVTLPPTPLRSPLSSVNLSLSGFLFVDDTDILYVGPSPDTPPALVRAELQKRVSLWEGLLQASGGALSASKCSWTSISFFPPSSVRLVHDSTLSSPGTLTISQGPIYRLEPWESTKVVGVVQSVNGSMKGQIRALLSLTKSWASKLSLNRFPRRLAWTALRSKVWASLRYPLSCTTLTKQEGHLLVARLYQQLLPRLGATRSLPNAFKFGPPRLQSLGLPHPYFYQGGIQLVTFVTLLLTDCVEEHRQLQLGTPTPFLALPYAVWGSLATPCWLTSLCKFVSDYAIQVDGFPECFPPLPCLHDQYLMDLLVSDGRLPPSIPCACNRVRLGLHSLTLSDLSDLSTGDGWKLRPDFSRPSRAGRAPSSPSSIEWPPSPFSPQDALLWEESLALLFGGGFWPAPLGPWISSPHLQSWEWWADPCDFALLYCCQSHSIWTVFKLQEGRRTRRQMFALHSPSCPQLFPLISTGPPLTMSPPPWSYWKALPHPSPDTFPRLLPQQTPPLSPSWWIICRLFPTTFSGL